MNYKKSILSLVTIMALSGTASADGTATYLPLTSDDNDASWTLFGVNGFSDGTASSRTAVAEGFTAGFTEVEELDTQDARATEGLTASSTDGSGSGYLLSVQAVDDTGMSELKVAAQILQAFEATEPVRSMYIKINSNNPNVKIDYKASMEGQTLELMMNGVTTLYEVTIDQDHTYANAAIAKESVSSASSNPFLSNIEDVLDYNFLNNPLDARYYSKSDHLETSNDMDDNGVAAESAIFYHFDSISQQWKVWNKKFSGSANDFTEFSKGDAYWGQIDTDDTDPNNDSAESNVTASGLILGSSGRSTPTADVYAGKLAPGWNMLAIDDSQPIIRYASTGLVATMVANDGNITITDSSGQHDVKIELLGSTDTISEQATKINVAIESAKLKHEIPISVNIKAFRTSATEIVIISDAKFTLTDEADYNNISTVKTLAGREPYNAEGLDGLAGTNAITDLNTSATDENKYVTSAYGEYALIIDLLVSDMVDNGLITGTTDSNRTAADLDAIAAATAGNNGGDTFSAKIKFGTEDRAYTPIALHATDDTTPDEASAKIEIEKHALFDSATSPTDAYGKALAIDTNGNGKNDKFLLASTVPFYIKDNTFTRVFDENNASNDGEREFTISGTRVKTVVPDKGDSTLDTAKDIRAVADGTTGTGVYADYNDTKLIAVSTTLSTFDLKDQEDGQYEFFTADTDSSYLAKGAVAGVYSLDAVSQLPVVQNKFWVDGFVFDSNTSKDNNTTIFFDGDQGAADYNASMLSWDVNVSDDDNVTAYFDTFVERINTKLQILKKHAYAYHTYESGNNNAASLLTTDIVIVGLDINGSTIVVTETDGTHTAVDHNNSLAVAKTATEAATPAAETLGISWGGLVSDLKTNAIYTPNFSAYGPLYTFKDAGYDVRSILKATTKFSDETIAWDGIDLTRDESDWFKNNEFNLFNANLNSGYWVYLEDISNNGLVINDASYTPTYTYYFDNKVGDEYSTKNIINGGQFTVEIKGFAGEISKAFLTVGGEEIPLERNGISDNYTADFMKYSLASFNEGSSGPISFNVRATDGKGTYLTASDKVAFDYTAPELITPDLPTINTLKFSDMDTNTSDIAKFHVYREYIPELASSRASANTDTSRFVGSYDATSGLAEVNICKGLTFGDVDNLRVVGVDGTGSNAGEIGFANVSNAIQFEYGVMLKGAHVLTHISTGLDDKSIIGQRYDTNCEATAAADANETENSGVSLKTLISSQTSRIAYEYIEGIGSSLSSAWTSTYSVAGVAIVQIQNLEEYAGKPFFLEYNGKMYRSAFPSTKNDADLSADDAILLDDSDTFLIDDEGFRETDSVTGVSGGTGELITTINSTLAPF